MAVVAIYQIVHGGVSGAQWWIAPPATTDAPPSNCLYYN